MSPAAKPTGELVITVALLGFAAFLLWKGDTAHAMICIALAVPNAQQVLASVRGSSSMLAELQTIRTTLAGVVGAMPVPSSETPTPIPPVRAASPPPPPASPPPVPPALK